DGAIDIDQAPAGTIPEPVKLAPEPMPEAAPDGPDLAQEKVIQLPCDARVLVDAGPGTGKTHVACKRIASLIRNGAEANRIWVISFTRTAVTEFRNRIATALGDLVEAASVRIATLDSHAWSLQSGFSQNAVLTGSYEDNILSTLERIREDSD